MEEIISYPVFKGLQKPLEFMGIRGKFIYYAAATFLCGFIGFLVFNITTVPLRWTNHSLN